MTEKSTSSSFGNILKSTTVLGGSMFINIIINLVRVKFMAILLGPLGIGIFGILTSITMLGSTIFEMGIFMSSVREISFYRGKKNKDVVNELIRLMRYLPFYMGLIAIIMFGVFSDQISQLSFDNKEMQLDVFLLGVAIFMNYVSKGNQTLMQAFQFTGKLARHQVISPAISSIIALSLYYFYRNDGIIWAILASSFITLIFSYYFSKDVRHKKSTIDKKERWDILKKMYKLGIAFMVDGIIVAALPYAIRLLLLELYDIQTIGIFVAATAITRQVVLLVLNTIKMDYYPRVSKNADDPTKLNQIINDQVQIGLMLGLPASLLLITFADQAILILYSKEFLSASPLIFWLTLGSLIQVLQWPLVYIFMAKSKEKIFVGINFWIYLVLQLILTYICNMTFGFQGIAIAFFITTVLMLLVTNFLLKRVIQFTWRSNNLRLFIITCVAFSALYICNSFHNIYGLACAFFISVAVGIYMLRSILEQLSDLPQVNRLIKKLPTFLIRIIKK